MLLWTLYKFTISDLGNKLFIEATKYQTKLETSPSKKGSIIPLLPGVH